MMNRKHVFIWHFLILLFVVALVTACVDNNNNNITSQTCSIPVSTTTQTLAPTILTPPKSIIIPPEPSYPMPYEKQLFYFVNEIAIEKSTSNMTGRFGDYQVYIDYPSNLYDKAMQTYIQSWINEKVDEKRTDKFPKYPGIARTVEGLTLSECKIFISIRDTINNIMEINVQRHLKFSSGQLLLDTDTYYLDILSGQEISINHIMNSKQGIEDLNQLVMHSYDVFVEAEEAEETLLYRTPFRQAFQGLPDRFNLLLRRNILSIEFDEHCVECHFMQSNYFLIEPLGLYNINGFTNTLYDRHFVTDKMANATPGKLMFNQVWEYDMYAKYIEVNDKNQFIPIQTYGKDVSPYLIKKSNELLKTLQLIVSDAENQFGFQLFDVAEDSYIAVRILHGGLLDTIKVEYNIKVHTNVYVKGILSRNYHHISHKEVALKDLFVSNYQYQRLVKEKFDWLLTMSQSSVSIDTVMAQLEQIDFELQDDKLILYTKPYQGDKRSVLQSLKVEFSIDELPVDIFQPFWK